jgi:hypothetical protein
MSLAVSVYVPTGAVAGSEEEKGVICYAYSSDR